MKAKAGLILASLLLFAAFPVAATAATSVKGNQTSRCDNDANGVPDAGCSVTGHYKDSYADSTGSCVANVTYRGDFGNTPYLDSGWINNEWVCKNADGTTSTYNYVIVSQGDPRYSGNPDWALWGSWEYHVLTQGGAGATGNLVRPYDGSET